MVSGGLSFSSCAGRPPGTGANKRRVRWSSSPVALVILLMAGCGRVTEGTSAKGADPIIRQLVDEGANLALDARVALASYMNAERIRIELHQAQAPANIATFTQKLEAAELKLQENEKAYQNTMDGIWEAIRAAEDPNLGVDARNVLSDYLPEAKARAEGVGKAYAAARAAADKYLDALRNSRLDQARGFHARYTESLEEVFTAGE